VKLGVRTLGISTFYIGFAEAKAAAAGIRRNHRIPSVAALHNDLGNTPWRNL